MKAAFFCCCEAYFTDPVHSLLSFSLPLVAHFKYIVNTYSHIYIE